MSEIRLVQSRKTVLSLYRNILRTAKIWVASTNDDNDTKVERQYIRDEAKMLFRRNRDLEDPADIDLAITEGETRLQLAIHYKNPYPRAVNVPPLATPKLTGKKLGKGQARMRKQAKPVYIQSHNEYDNT